MATATEKLAQQIEAIRRQLNSRTPQLPNSSLDNGAVTLINDGQVTGYVGTQFDGTSGVAVVAGPIPPIPTAPTVDTVIGGVLVTWDGNYQTPQTGYVSPVVAPMDFLRVDVEVSEDPGFPIVGFGNVHGVISSAAGGKATISWPNSGATVYVRLRTVTTAAKRSDPGLTISATSGLVNLGDLGFDITDYAGGNTIYFGSSSPTPPSTGFTAGDLWLQDQGTTGGSGQPLYLTYRWNGSAWVLLQDQGISQSLANALAAQTTANSATTLANAAQTTANGKITTFYQGTAPVSGMAQGDLWVNTASGNALSRYNGSSWIAIQDAAISTALANANTAQTTADRKIQVFAQPNQPTAGEVGDVWIDLDDGNAEYVWGPIATVTRHNYAKNPSFEFDTAGTLVPTGWTNSTGGTTGTVTASVVASGATYGTRVGKIVGAGLSTLNTAWVGFQQTITAVPGDLLQLTAFGLAFGVASASQRPEWMVEWLNASNAVISTLTDTTAAVITVGSRTSYAYTTTAAPALTASARITLRRRGTLTTGGTTVTNADMSIDAMLFERNRPSNSQTDYFDGGFPTTTESIWDVPGSAPNSTSTYWEPGTSGTNAWQKQMIRSGAIQPQSLVAANIIATGTITAALLEVNMVLATTVNAGPLAADHSSMAPDGFHVYRTITGEGLLEVGRLGGGGAGGFLGFVNSTGQMVSNIDENGVGTFAGLSTAGDPVFNGIPLSVSLSTAGGGNAVASSYNSTMAITGITTEVGIGEISFIQDTSHSYWIKLHLPHIYTGTAGTDAQITLRYTTDGSSPTVTSTVVDSELFTLERGSSYTYSVPDLDIYGNFPGANGSKIRILATVASIAGGGSLNLSVGSGGFFRPFRMWAMDMGLNIPDTYIANTGGGGVTSKTTYSTGNIAKSGGWSYTGGGSLRSDTNDIVQGTDPSGFNGDGKGGWNFTIPNISGTINFIHFWVYNNHSYYNSGSHILLYPVVNANTPTPTALQSVWDPGVTIPPASSYSFALPSSWFSSFLGKTSIGIYIGPSSLVSGAGNELYYLRADGPSALLSINYTQ